MLKIDDDATCEWVTVFFFRELLNMKTTQCWPQISSVDEHANEVPTCKLFQINRKIYSFKLLNFYDEECIVPTYTGDYTKAEGIEDAYLTRWANNLAVGKTWL